MYIVFTIKVVHSNTIIYITILDRSKETQWSLTFVCLFVTDVVFVFSEVRVRNQRSYITLEEQRHNHYIVLFKCRGKGKVERVVLELDFDKWKRCKEQAIVLFKERRIESCILGCYKLFSYDGALQYQLILTRFPLLL